MSANGSMGLGAENMKSYDSFLNPSAIATKPNSDQNQSTEPILILRFRLFNEATNPVALSRDEKCGCLSESKFGELDDCATLRG